MRIDLDQARRRAKERLRAWREAGDRPGAKLADAQREVARELGQPSRPALVRRAEAEAVASADRAARMVEWATLYVCPFGFLRPGGPQADGLVECGRMLLEAGADPDAAFDGPGVGPAPLGPGDAGMLADAAAGGADALAPLLDLGLPVDARERVNGGAALHHAAFAGDPEAVALGRRGGAALGRPRRHGRRGPRRVAPGRLPSATRE